MNRDEFISLLELHGLGEVSDAVLATARECIRLDVAEGTSTKDSIGESKIGGVPNLSESAEWPCRNGKPLTFLAQIALAQLPETNEPVGLPSAGLLAFFYDAEQQPWGFDPKDIGASRVLHVKNPMILEQQASSVELAKVAQFPERLLRPQKHYSLPTWQHKEAQSLCLDEDMMDAYEDVRTALRSDDSPTCHQLLGWPDEIQNPMELECQLVTNGLYCGDATGYKGPRAAALVHDADDWRLLFQLDSDDCANMMWGDAGRLYFWIRRQELRNCSFDRTWTILQCY